MHRTIRRYLVVASPLDLQDLHPGPVHVTVTRSWKRVAHVLNFCLFTTTTTIGIPRLTLPSSVCHPPLFKKSSIVFNLAMRAQTKRMLPLRVISQYSLLVGAQYESLKAILRNRKMDSAGYITIYKPGPCFGGCLRGQRVRTTIYPILA